ncbi:MAG TPA: heme d1 biosynthesis radical SAM protein NirJ, partial [Burkholderiaceae bacterium]|nr:heme d1 biosynthesis radical SAM protein NirJ [Burkholderiaceae bacterium]
MLRISHYLREIAQAERDGVYPSPRRAASGGETRPVVIWNLTRRCNLTCKHCY